MSINNHKSKNKSKTELNGGGESAITSVKTPLSQIFMEKREAISQSIETLGLFSKKDLAAVIAPIQIKKRFLNQWAQDILSLHNLIYRLGQKKKTEIKMELEKYGVEKSLLDHLDNDKNSSGPFFFRPDCILTSEGLRILEFNVDYGAMGITSGGSLVRIYQSQLPLEWHTAVAELFPADRIISEYFREVAHNSNIKLWDLQGRSTSIIADNKQTSRLLTNHGISSDWVYGDSLMDALKAGHYVFRTFAHMNMLIDPKLISMFSDLTTEHLLKNDLGLRSLLYDSKALLAAAWTDDDCLDFSESDIELLRSYIPQTILLNRDINNRQNIEDKNEILKQRERWVIKPEFGFKGEKVVIGKFVTQREWEETISTVVSSKGRHIIQEYQDPVRIKQDIAKGSSIVSQDFSHVINFYYVNSIFAGANLRLATEGIKIGAINQETIFGSLIEGV